VLVTVGSKSICNRFALKWWILAQKSHVLKRYPHLTPPHRGILELKWPKFKPLKSTFNVDNFIMQLVLADLQPFRRNLLLKRVSHI